MSSSNDVVDMGVMDSPVDLPDQVRRISVIVPTYKEVLNIPHIIDRLAALRDSAGLEIELIFMDDKSRDGSQEVVANAGLPWVYFVEREGPRGLSPAVLDGFARASHPILVCMDCDLSHPPEKIPQMLLALMAGHDCVVGSRYVAGGTTDDDWGFGRWLNSQIATLLARPLTDVKDPMSGFFALRKSDFERGRDLNPIGYKIGLELIVKCGLGNVAEVPIHFTDRVLGESKLSFKEQLLYLQHVRRLYLYKFSDTMHVLQFLIVGASGVLVNFAVLALLSALGFREAVSLAGGIAVSIVTNFLLNRRFTFSYAKSRKLWPQFIGFMGASAVGAIVNYSVALYLTQNILPNTGSALYIASAIGVASGMIFNFLGNRYLVFRKRHIRR